MTRPQSAALPQADTSPLASPIPSPMGSVSGDTEAQVRGEFAQVTSPTHAASGAVLFSSVAGTDQSGGVGVGSPVRVTARKRRQLQASLADRDWQVLLRLREHGYMTSQQVQAFVFTGHASDTTARRTTSRVLARLARDQLVRSLPRRQGGPLGGSSPQVWQLTTSGRRLLEESRPGWRAQVPSQHRLLHSLAVADAHLAILGHQSDAQVQIEPACWRIFSGIGGERRTMKPDLFASVPGHDADGEFVDRWFIEVDLGTESLPTLLRKCQTYEGYRSSGIEQADNEAFPLVLWVFVGSDRSEQLHTAIQRRAGLTPALYRYATPSSLADILATGAAS